MSIIRRARIWPIQAPLQQPIRTSFGQMDARRALLLSIEDNDGRVGWGEAWVNFPEWALEVNTSVLCALARLILHKQVDPEGIANRLYHRFRTPLVQSLQWGPFFQALSAINMALYDLVLQEQGAGRTGSIPVYGSGIGPEDVKDRVERAVRQGFTQVKIKVGFDRDLDHRNFRLAQDIVGRDGVMVDANQGWDADTALQEVPWYVGEGAVWIEEPVSALDLAGYQALFPWRDHLASGENWVSESFLGSHDLPQVAVLQPDLSKVGGFWGAYRLVDFFSGRFDRVAFHVLGTAVVHAAAFRGYTDATMPVRVVEYDTNENPFDGCVMGDWTISRGVVRQAEQRPGLCATVDTERLRSFLVPELQAWYDPTL